MILESSFMAFWRCVNAGLKAAHLPTVEMGRAHAYWLADYSIAEVVKAESDFQTEAA
jgi:hypothetical protein